MVEHNAIIKGCLTGNKSSQEQLYNLFAKKMYAVCLRYACDTEQAKDIMQDGFIKVFENLRQYEGKGTLEGWIRRIIINTALELLRKKTIINYKDEMPADITDNETSLEDLSAQEIMTAIGELSPQYKLVFNLYAIEGYSHKEIAQMLHISEGTSKSNYARAKKVLKAKILQLNSRLKVVHS